MHWVVGAAVVVGFAALTVATCGGSLAAAATAVSLVSYGVAASTTATTVAAAAFIGSAMVYSAAVVEAVCSFRSVDEFAEKGNWGTVAATAGGGVVNAISSAITIQRSSNAQSKNVSYNLNGSKDSNYVNKRGWTNDMINKAICNGKQGTSVNMANGAPCTVYCYPGTDNQYVVIENSSRSVVQVSDFGDTGWIPDSRIVWDP